MIHSGGATPGRVRDRNISSLAAALAVNSGNNKMIYFDLLMRLMTCLCPAISSGQVPPLMTQATYRQFLLCFPEPTLMNNVTSAVNLFSDRYKFFNAL